MLVYILHFIEPCSIRMYDSLGSYLAIQYVLFLGTNDKAATAAYLQKWVSIQSVKEQTVPLTEWSYPSVDQ